MTTPTTERPPSRKARLDAVKREIAAAALRGIREHLSGPNGSVNHGPAARAEACWDDPRVLQVDCRVGHEPITLELTIRELFGSET